MSKVQEVYEKFKHLDLLLSDREWLGGDVVFVEDLNGEPSSQPRNIMLWEFWQAIREEATNEA